MLYFKPTTEIFIYWLYEVSITYINLNFIESEWNWLRGFVENCARILVFNEIHNIAPNTPQTNVVGIIVSQV